jgi:hypothetical protein
MVDYNKNNNVNLIGIDTQYDADVDGVFRKHTQNITQDFLDDIKEQRDHSKDKREGDFMRVASIPTVVVEKWMREGFNILDPNVNGKEIIRRLKAENLDAFLTTDKSI